MDYRELPEEFLEKMKQFLGEEYPEYLASYEEEPRSGPVSYTHLVENTAGDGEDTKKAWEILREIARARSCLLKGSELDTKKAAGFLLDDFRSGKLGLSLIHICVHHDVLLISKVAVTGRCQTVHAVNYLPLL